MRQLAFRPARPFIYFDLGNVLLRFDHELACRQMAEVAGVSPHLVREVVFQSQLQWQYERGMISTEEFYESFCRATGRRPDRQQLARAASAIFELNVPVVPLVTQLRAAGYRLGILSNTCEAHWHYVTDGRYRILTELFDVAALSFQLRSLKPEPEIFRRAAELAGVPPEEIFFVDDRQENVAAACRAGLDAVPFTTPADLATALRHRAVRFNY